MMNKPFRIEARESFRVIGYCVHTTNKRKEGRKAIPQQWEELQTQGLQKDKGAGRIYRTGSNLGSVSMYD